MSTDSVDVDNLETREWLDAFNEIIKTWKTSAANETQLSFL